MKLKQQLPRMILLVILTIGGFLRLYRIGDYMAFLGDEGRDALVVKRMIVDGEFTLLGPITSVGLMHLGPIYYYFMAPFLWLTDLDPVGPAIMVALFSLATIFLIWKLCREFFDLKTAFIAAILYALSPLVIVHSHSSWNPNILPFWALLVVYGLMKATVKKEYKWLFISGLAFGVAIQLHYVALAFIPITLAILLLNRFKPPPKYIILLVAGSLLTFSPFIIFELRHQFINTLTVWQFLTRGGDAKTFGLISPLFMFWDLTVRLFWRLIVVENSEASKVFLFFILGGCLYLLSKWRRQTLVRAALIQLLLWYGVGIALLSIYTGIVYDYYLMFLFPMPFIATGVVLSRIVSSKIGAVIVLSLLTTITYVHIKHTPIRQEPNRLVDQTREIAHFILEKTSGRPYNFALIAAGNSDHAYRYFLEIDGYPPTVIEYPGVDPERTSVTDQLFVVCEEKECGPLGHSLWEIAGFGRAEIESEWHVGLFKVFKLVHYYGL